MSNKTAVKVGGFLLICWFVLSTCAVAWRKSVEDEKRAAEEAIKLGKKRRQLDIRKPTPKPQTRPAKKAERETELHEEDTIASVYPPYQDPVVNTCSTNDKQNGLLYWVKRDYNNKLPIPTDAIQNTKYKIMVNGQHVKDTSYKKTGLHCIELLEPSGCLLESSQTAVQHHSRQGTEYGVELFSYPKFVPLSRAVALSLRMSVRIVLPSVFVKGLPIPIFVVAYSTGFKSPFDWAAVPMYLSLSSQGNVYEDNIKMYRGVTSFWGIQEGVQPPPECPSQREAVSISSEISVRLTTSRDGKKGTQFVGEVAVVQVPELISRSTSISWKEFLEGSDGHTPPLIELSKDEDAIVPSNTTITIPAGTIILMGKDSIIKVNPGGTLNLIGTVDHTITMVSSVPGSAHCGVFIEHGGQATAAHFIASGSGCLRKRPKDTGKHKKSYPLFSSRGKLSTEHIYALELHGPGYGLADTSTTNIKNNFLTGLEQGGECVFCNITIKQSYIGSLPDDNSHFVDGDNDGFYFRGGRSEVETLVVVNSKDDCIDSASSKEHFGGTLRISNSILHNCIHEGIALSGSHIDSPRHVVIKNIIIFGAQQGIEVGYSPRSHTAFAESVVFSNNQVALRIGDNYNLKVEGALSVSNSLIQSNSQAVRNYTKLTPRHQSPILRISDSLVQADCISNHCGNQQWIDAGGNYILDSNAKPIIDPMTGMILVMTPIFNSDSIFDEDSDENGLHALNT